MKVAKKIFKVVKFKKNFPKIPTTDECPQDYSVNKFDVPVGVNVYYYHGMALAQATPLDRPTIPDRK